MNDRIPYLTHACAEDAPAMEFAKEQRSKMMALGAKIAPQGGIPQVRTNQTEACVATRFF
jgi:hypothetical protein